MQRWRALLNPAGGIRYHAKAWRHGARWEPFRTAIGAWLTGWRPPPDALLLVGPSAGYCLPDGLLERFARIDAVEPDPIARRLFRRRRPSLAVHWHDDRWLVPLSTAGLDRLLRDFPDHALLFCNILGQVGFLDPLGSREPELAAWKTHLGERLQERAFATFHDRLSGSAPLCAPAAGPAMGDDELARRSVPPQSGPATIELESHGMADLFPALPRHYFVWELERGWYHLIEGIAQDP